MNSPMVPLRSRHFVLLLMFGAGATLWSGCAGRIARIKDESLTKSAVEATRPVSSTPSDYRAYVAFLRATDLDRVGETKQAEKWLKKAIDYDPGSPTLQLRYGSILAEQQKLDKALEATRTAIAMDPADYEARLQLGDLLQIDSQFDAAEKAYRDAIALAPEREEAYLDLAYLYRVEDDPEQGLQVLEKLRELNGTLSVRPTLLEAALYKDLDKRVEAEAAFLFVLDEYPELRVAQKALFDLYLLDGDLEAAARRLEAVYAERPWMDWIPRALIELYARLGDVEAINRHLRAR